MSCFPLNFPLQAQNVFDIPLHPGGALLLHLICNMAVHVQGEGCRCMAQIPLNGFDIVAGTDRGHGVRVAQIVETGVRTSD